ncbi:hypothetical protein P691DRAFT_243995 [Macrolepiota fuliginosa MF-IS2]|uniref:Uncharacterized protein n=1 Tax=Macrolepiota fuliginosa MF-IS2 TaxID=1400762 RepID=A0A9P5X9F8_9AGAR|nr:hypothetical protein P691DRAFT_243995 [Macrolepiota fuliginosa MF-IS2]
MSNPVCNDSYWPLPIPPFEAHPLGLSSFLPSSSCVAEPSPSPTCRRLISALRYGLFTTGLWALERLLRRSRHASLASVWQIHSRMFQLLNLGSDWCFLFPWLAFWAPGFSQCPESQSWGTRTAHGREGVHCFPDDLIRVIFTKVLLAQSPDNWRAPSTI